MAPRKPTVAAKSAKESITAERGKIVKRPARGYHRYKNGQLNVTPKGDEKDIAKINQNSPLLRLPPEIRNRIWEYTLGRTVFRAHYYKRLGRRPLAIFTSPFDEPSIGLSLLRACRQIYAEAASMPISQNIFAFKYLHDLVEAAGQLKPYQCRLINTIRFEYSGYSESEWYYIHLIARLRQICPTAKRLQCIAFDQTRLVSSKAWKPVETLERRIREQHGSTLDIIGMSLTGEGVDAEMPDSIRSVYLFRP